jgi:Protein of unknown function (DUF4239)
MTRGKPSHHASDGLEALSTAVFQVQPQGFQQHALYQNALRLLTVIADNRGERLDSADGSVPLLLWFVLIVGGMITLGYPAFFGASNRLAQMLMTATLAAPVALSLLLALALDYPFTGDEKISVLLEEAHEQMPPALPSH